MKYLVKNKYWNIVEDYNIDKLLYLLTDRPDEISEWGEIVWLNNSKSYDRDYDLPAVYSNDDYIVWWRYGNHYRKNNKPVIIWFNGYQKYYINGKFIKSKYKSK